MSETTSADDRPDEPLDPKEAMRQALEAKKAAQHKTVGGVDAVRQRGEIHGKASGKRQFRRKSGG